MDYKQLTLKDITDVINDLSKPTDKEFVIYTGYRGMMEFDLVMMFMTAGVLGSFTIKHMWGKPLSRNNSFDKLKSNNNKYIHKLIEISLIEKSGMWKLRFYRDKKFPLHLYHGTTLIMQTNDLSSLNNYVK